jgi:hypothetical protein
VSEENARPQDVGRSHHRSATTPAPATIEVLERYREAMRAELGDVLEELRPPAAQLTLAGSAERLRPPLAERLKLWDLAIKLGRELAAPAPGGDPDPGAELEAGPAATGPRRSRRDQAPRLSARERRALGG